MFILNSKNNLATCYFLLATIQNIDDTMYNAAGGLKNKSSPYSLLLHRLKL